MVHTLLYNTKDLDPDPLISAKFQFHESGTQSAKFSRFKDLYLYKKYTLCSQNTHLKCLEINTTLKITNDLDPYPDPFFTG